MNKQNTPLFHIARRVGAAGLSRGQIWTIRACSFVAAILIGALIAWEEAGVGNGFPPAFFYNALTVGAGEAVACYVLGIPLLGMIEKRIKLN